MYPLIRLTADGIRDHAQALAGLLVDTVAGGNSLGFRTPFGPEAAKTWWLDRRDEVAEGELAVWAADGPHGITGTISLATSDIPNGRHRGEILKLMVHRTARGQGLGRVLLATAEAAAARAGLSLLVLDTVADTAAERLYLSAGWVRYGTIPGYATDPVGALEDCSFFYKQLRKPEQCGRGSPTSSWRSHRTG